MPAAPRRPSPGRASTGCAAPRPRTSTASGATSSTRSTPADQHAIERGLGRVIDGLDDAGATVGRRRDDGRLTTDRAAPDGAGRVLAGTSGFSYAAWAPRFYPAGSRSRDLLPHYASRLARLRAQQHVLRPPDGREDRRLVRRDAAGRSGSSSRPSAGPASGRCTADPATSVPWLTETLPGFGERLGAVLFRVPGEVKRQDDKLAGLLDGLAAVACRWSSRRSTSRGTSTRPSRRCAAAGVVLCTTDLDDAETPPDIRRTGPFLYLRLRRTTYDDAALDAWARRAGAVPRRRPGRVRPVPPRRGRHERDPRGGVRGPRRAGRAPADGRRLTVRTPARDPSAGPNTTIRRSVSVMSWNRCGTPAATNSVSPGPTSLVSAPAVNRDRPSSTT